MVSYIFVGNSVERNISLTSLKKGEKTAQDVATYVLEKGYVDSYNCQDLAYAIDIIYKYMVRDIDSAQEVVSLISDKLKDPILFFRWLSAEFNQLYPFVKRAKDGTLYLSIGYWNDKVKHNQALIRRLIISIFDYVFPYMNLVVGQDIYFDSRKGKEVYLKGLKDIVANFKAFYSRYGLEEVYIPTVGQKAVSEILHTVAMLFPNVHIIYGVEGGDPFVLPHFPVSIDLVLLQNHISAIRSGKVPSDEDWTIFAPLTDMLVDIAERSRHYIPVSLKKDYRDIAEASVPRLSYLWSADRIPETVEHSSGHSRRIVERFLYLRGIERFVPEMLREEFKFTILMAAYIHDIGHTIPVYKDRPVMLFPDIVRRYHNIFSVYMMEQQEEYLNLSVLRERYPYMFDSIYLVSLYHRKSTHVADKEGHGDKKFEQLFEEKFPPVMIEHERFMSLPKYYKKMVLFATLLFKILDEIDVQVDRVVDEDFEVIRNMMSNWESDTIEKLLKERYSFKKNVQDAIIDMLIEDRERWEDMELSLLSSYHFKRIQREHFYKHKAIKAVVPYYDDSHDEIVIEIYPQYTQKNEQYIEEMKRDIERQRQLIMADLEHIKRFYPDVSFPWISVVVKS